MSTKRKKATGTPEDQYFRALAFLDDTSKYLKNAGSDIDLLHTVGRLVKYLRGKTSAEIHTILGSVKTQQPSTNISEEQETEEQISSLTADQLRQRLSDVKLSRKALERIAKIRFGVSIGALSTLRDKKSLHDKLLTLIANEGTHDSIAKLASISKLPPTQ
jgi:hypothetical protein